MGLGLEGANAAHGLLINQLQTSLMLARAGAVVHSGRRNPGIAACVPDAERGNASIAVAAPDTVVSGGPHPVARTTADPQHHRCRPPHTEA
jgi:hypothetical protein